MTKFSKRYFKDTRKDEKDSEMKWYRHQHKWFLTLPNIFFKKSDLLYSFIEKISHNALYHYQKPNEELIKHIVTLLLTVNIKTFTEHIMPCLHDLAVPWFKFTHLLRLLSLVHLREFVMAKLFRIFKRIPLKLFCKHITKSLLSISSSLKQNAQK